MAAVTFGINEDNLTEEDKPSYPIHTETHMVLKPTEGFAFGAEVHPGYFQVKFENTSGSAKKFGQGPTGNVRIKISWPNLPWSKVIHEDVSITSLTHKLYSQTFCIHTAARLDILLKHNGHSQPIGFRNCQFDIQINSCFSKESFMVTNAGIQPIAVVEQWWEKKGEVIMWRSLAGDALNARQGFAAVGVGHEVLIFGGEDGDKVTNQLLLLDCKREKLLQFGDMFHRKDTENTALFTGVCPAPRTGHSAVVWNGKAVYFGGFAAPDNAPTAEVTSFYIHERIWAIPDQGTSGVSRAAAGTIARGFHTAVAWQDAMYVFGGCTDIMTAKTMAPSNFVSTPVWKYTFAERRWQQLHTSNLPHGGKVYGHGAVCVGGLMYVFGGMTEKGMSGDLFALDLSRHTWSYIQTTGKAPVKRAFPCFWALESQLAEGEEQLIWPVPRLRLERAKGAEDTHLNQLQALCVFGGHGGGKPTTENIFVLNLKPFRGHAELEWFTKAVAEPQLRISPSPDGSPSGGQSSGSGGSKFFGAVEEKFSKAGKLVDKQFDHLRGPKDEYVASYSANPLIGSHALVLGHGGQLNLVLLGLGPPTASLPADLPELTVVEGIQPFDFRAHFTAPKEKPPPSEEDAIVMAFSQFEQAVEMFQAQLNVVHRIQQQGLGSEFAEACQELRTLVKKANKLCLKFPVDAFGAKGADLLQLFEVLQQKWNLLMETIPPEVEAESEEEHEVAEGAENAPNAELELSVNAATPLTSEADKKAGRIKRISNTFKDVGKKTLALPKGMRHIPSSASPMPASPYDRVSPVTSPRPAISPRRSSQPLDGIRTSFLPHLPGMKSTRSFMGASQQSSPAPSTVKANEAPAAAAVTVEAPAAECVRGDSSALDRPLSAAEGSSHTTTAAPMIETPEDGADASSASSEPITTPSPHSGQEAAPLPVAQPDVPLVTTDAAPVEHTSSEGELPWQVSEDLSQTSNEVKPVTPTYQPVPPLPRNPWNYSPMSLSSASSDAPWRLFRMETPRDGPLDGPIGDSQAAYNATLAAIEAQLKCLGGARSQSLMFRQSACNVLHHLLEQALWLRPVGLPDDQRLNELMQQANETFATSGALEWESGGTATSVSVLVEEDVRSESHVSESEHSDSLTASTPHGQHPSHSSEPGTIDAALLREFETQLSLLQESMVVVKRLKGSNDSHTPQHKGLKSLNPAGLLRMGTKRKELEASRQELRHRVNKCSQISKAIPNTPQTSEMLNKFGVMLSEAQLVYSAHP